MSKKDLLSLVERAANEALASRPPEDREALGTENTAPTEALEEPPKDITVICGFCKKDLYRIDRCYLSKVLLEDLKLDPANVIPLGKYGKNSSLQVECPTCGEVVFNRKHRGGMEFLTKEEGWIGDDPRVPGVRHGPMHYMVHDSAPTRWR